jgi:hypothetical protein
LIFPTLLHKCQGKFGSRRFGKGVQSRAGQNEADKTPSDTAVIWIEQHMVFITYTRRRAAKSAKKNPIIGAANRDPQANHPIHSICGVGFVWIPLRRALQGRRLPEPTRHRRGGGTPPENLRLAPPIEGV